MSDNELVLIERHGRRAEIVLNRPDRRNAVIGPLAIELRTAVESLSADQSVGVIVLRGADGAFCSGLDLKEFRAAQPPEWVAHFSEYWRAVHLAIFRCTKPIIGALERFAINGGAALALACDLLIAGETAFLQVGEVQMSSAAPMNLAWLRLRHSEATTSRLALVGDRINGPDLLRLGVATECVPDSEVLTAAYRLADTIAAYPPGAAEQVKVALRARAPHEHPETLFG